LAEQLVPKSVTLNDLERRSGHYFALLHRMHHILKLATSKRLEPVCPRSGCDRNVVHRI